MVAVMAAEYAQVERRAGVVRERAHPVIVEAARQRTLIEGAAPDIDHGLDESIVHRDRAVAVAGEGRRRETGDRRADHNADILDQVVLEITAGLELEVQ